jgi:hypothetical protein
MVRLLADENFPLPVTEALKRIGYDVLTLTDLDLAGQALSDHAVLQLASKNARALLTINRKHFVRLHRMSTDHAGIVTCTVDLDFEGQAGRIHAAISTRTSLNGELLRVNRAGNKPLAGSESSAQ